MAKYTTQWLKHYRGWRNEYQDFDDAAKALFFARRHSLDIWRVVRVIDAETGEVLAIASRAKWEAWKPKLMRADVRDALVVAQSIDLDKPSAADVQRQLENDSKHHQVLPPPCEPFDATGKGQFS